MSSVNRFCGKFFHRFAERPYMITDNQESYVVNDIGEFTGLSDNADKSLGATRSCESPPV
jgi:hypothetical protein